MSSRQLCATSITFTSARPSRSHTSWRTSPQLLLSRILQIPWDPRSLATPNSMALPPAGPLLSGPMLARAPQPRNHSIPHQQPGQQPTCCAIHLLDWTILPVSFQDSLTSSCAALTVMHTVSTAMGALDPAGSSFYIPLDLQKLHQAYARYLWVILWVTPQPQASPSSSDARCSGTQLTRIWQLPWSAAFLRPRSHPAAWPAQLALAANSMVSATAWPVQPPRTPWLSSALLPPSLILYLQSQKTCPVLCAIAQKAQNQC
jgi:hypothetical protein